MSTKEGTCPEPSNPAQDKRAKRAEGFTLIELLIVIAVIGLLSSIVLVNVTSSRESARIAAGLQLSSSLKHSLGAYLVGEWSFDNNDARDDSGNGNNGTVNGATPVDGIIGRAMQFDGVDDYVDVPNNPNLENNAKGTIELWFMKLGDSGGPSWSAGGLIRYRGGRPLLYEHDSNKIQVTWGGASGMPVSTSYTNSYSFDRNKWQHLVFSWTSTHYWMYLNGELKEENNFVPSAQQLVSTRIGEYSGHTMNGYVDEVRVYNQTLSLAEIQQHYAEGLEKHNNLVQK